MRRAFCVLALGVAIAPAPALAGAWLMDQGKGQVVVTFTPSRADQGFDGDWSRVDVPRTSKFDAQALIEYGVTRDLTAIVSPSLQLIGIGAPVSAERNGFGFTDAGARAALMRGEDWILSGQVLARIPGTYDSSNPAAIGYTDPELDVRALLGKSFSLGTWPAFVDVQMAQRFRFGDAPHEFRVDATFGVRFAPQWLLLAQSFNVFSEGAAMPLFPAYQYHKLQMSVVYDITKEISLQAGGFTTYAGRNALQENGALLGVWYRF